LVAIDPAFIPIPFEAYFGPFFSFFDQLVTLAVKQLGNHFTLVTVFFSQGNDSQMADTVFQIG
jgi:hypothetical protein